MRSTSFERFMKNGDIALALVLVTFSVCGSVTGTAGTSGTAGTGGGVCSVQCMTGSMCCGGTCVNHTNDPFNCGKCGNVCPSGAPFCGSVTCQQVTCAPNVTCVTNTTCCGNM